MNKETMRKLLEDCWDEGRVSGFYEGKNIYNDKVKDKYTYITARLAALDDGNDGRRAVKEFSLVLYRLMKSFNDIQRNEQQEKHWKEAEYIQQKNFSVNDILRVDDGQEGKATMKELVKKIFGDEAAEDKDIVDFYERVHQTAIEETALPVADGEGEKVGEWQLCPKCLGDGNLLRYNSPSIMGTNANPVCDVCRGNKIIPKPLLPSAVTGGVKEYAIGFDKWKREENYHESLHRPDRWYIPSKNTDAFVYFTNEDLYEKYLSEGQPEQGGKP